MRFGWYSLAAVVTATFCSPMPLAGQVEVVEPAPPKPGQPSEDRPTLVRMTVSPAEEPYHALRYRLLPHELDLKPGNAAASYRRALLLFRQSQESFQREFYERYEKWREMPLAELPVDEVRRTLGGFGGLLLEVERGTHRETCDWDLRAQDLSGSQVIELLLPEIQDVRTLARILELKARLEIREGAYEDALRSLQQGFRLGRDVAEEPILINGLVGIACCSLMNGRVEELIAAPDSPNLYWALATLPRPLVDLQPAIRFEMSIGERLFPFLREAERVEWSADRWRHELRQGMENLLMLARRPPGVDDQTRDSGIALATTALAMVAYPRAKRILVEAGFDPREVEQMPVGKAIALAEARIYFHIRDEMVKYVFLPYSQARQRHDEAQQRLYEQGYLGPMFASRELIPIASLLLPAVVQARLASERLDRHIALLRTIEALRMYAASEGNWPDSLEAITQVPVPVDPFTGKPFSYRRDGDTARLEMTAPPHLPVSVYGRIYEIRLRPPAGQNP